MDGGLYRFDRIARSADTGKEVVVYEHRWPFDPSFWARDKEEFEARFTLITEMEYLTISASMLRADGQAAVTAAKAARRAKRDQSV